jgi:CDP-diacylglycerol--serine O-phosphatidyltransferase
MTIFVLFGIVLFFGLLLIYTFKVLLFGGLIYICLIPMSYLYYQKVRKQKNIDAEQNNNEEPDDIL